MNPLHILSLILTGIIALCVNIIVNLSEDLAIERDKARDIVKLQTDHEKAIENARSDCDKKVEKAIKHERNMRDVKDSISNPDSGIVNIGL